MIIAESQILLARVRAARIAAIERSRKPPSGIQRIIPGFPIAAEFETFHDEFDRGDLHEGSAFVYRTAISYRAGLKKYLAEKKLAIEAAKAKQGQCGEAPR